MLIPAGPFAGMCVAYCIIGFTLAVQAAQAIGFGASLKRDSAGKMGFLHGIYGKHVGTSCSKAVNAYHEFHTRRRPGCACIPSRRDVVREEPAVLVVPLHHLC